MGAAPKQERTRRDAPRFVESAKALLLQRQPAEAIDLLRRGLALDPDNTAAARLLVKSLIAAKRLDEARALLERQIRRQEDAESYRLLIRVCLALDDALRAFEVAAQATERFTQDARLNHLRQRAQDALLQASPFDTGPEDEPTEEDARRPAGSGQDPAEQDTPRYGAVWNEQAPQLAEEVDRFVAAGNREPSSVFNQLLGDGPMMQSVRLVDGRTQAQRDEDNALELETPDIGGPTPPATPRAKLRLIKSARYRRREPRSELVQAVLDAPTPSVPIAEPQTDPAEAPSDELPTPPVPQTRPGPIAEIPSTPARTPGISPSTKRLAGNTLDMDEQVSDPEISQSTELFLEDPLTERFRPLDQVLPDDPALERMPAPPPATNATAWPASREQGDQRPAQIVDEPPARAVDEPSRHDETIPSIPHARHPGRENRQQQPRPLQTPPAPPALRPFPLPPAGRAAPARRATPIATPVARRKVTGPLSQHRLAATEPAAPRAQRTRFESFRRVYQRFWPIWLAAAVAVIAGATAIGVTTRRRAQGRVALAEARKLATRHQAWAMRRALYRAQDAANLAGRTADVVALAASVHARLAVEFGESDLGGVRSLVDEAGRLDTSANAVARRDLTVARTYLAFATRPLPKALDAIRKAAQQTPKTLALDRLYARALMHDDQLQAANDLLQQLPSDNAAVLRLLAEVNFRGGHAKLARAYLDAAIQVGLAVEQAQLDEARFELRSGDLGIRTQQLAPGLAQNERLSRAERAWAHLVLAASQRRHEPTAARASLAQAVELTPPADSEFFFEAAKLLQSFGELNKAHDLLARARATTPSNVRYIGLQARLDLAMDRALDAIKKLESLPALDADGSAVLIAAYTQQGQLDDARAALKQLTPDSPRRLALEARILVAEGKPEAALQHLDALRDDDPDVLLARGLAALGTDALSRASEAFSALLKRNPLHAEANWGIARVALRRADAHGARVHLEQAVKANPYRLRYRLDLGRLLLELERFADARPHFDAALRADPQDLSALAGRARASVELGLRAMDRDLAALAAAGHRNMTMLLSARRYMVLGNWAEAEVQLDSIDGRWLRTNLTGRLWTADVNRKRGRDALAATVYRELLRHPQARPAARLALSQLKLEENDVKLATEHVNAALKATRRGIFPDALRARIHVQLARCLRKNGSLDAAIGTMHEALRYDPHGFQVNLLLGSLYLTVKQPTLAIERLGIAIAANGKSDKARGLLGSACAKVSRDERPAACSQGS